MSKAAKTRRAQARGKRTTKGHKAASRPPKLTRDRDSKGRFKTGNVVNLSGRPRGPMRNLNDEFLKALEAAWMKSGAATIEEAMAKYPDLSLMAAASLVSKEVRYEMKPFIDEHAVNAARRIAALAALKAQTSADEPKRASLRR